MGAAIGQDLEMAIPLAEVLDVYHIFPVKSAIYIRLCKLFSARHTVA
jgi:hypothetical protein